MEMTCLVGLFRFAGAFMIWPRTDTGARSMHHLLESSLKAPTAPTVVTRAPAHASARARTRGHAPRDAGLDHFVQALRIYRDQHGHVCVPGAFQVDTEALSASAFASTVTGSTAWPDDFHGYHLGRHVARLRARRKHTAPDNQMSAPLLPDEVAQLNGLGFVWDVGEYKFDTFCSLLGTYRDRYCDPDVQHGRGSLDVHVPMSFVVPDAPGWPRCHAGYRLGLRAYSARQGSVFTGAEQRRVLCTRFGFASTGTASATSSRSGRSSSTISSRPKRGPYKKGKVGPTFETVYSALHIFKERHGTANVPAGFVVPAEDTVRGSGPNPWPTAARGLRLHAVVKRWRKEPWLLSTEQTRLLVTTPGLGLQLNAAVALERAFILAVAHYKHTCGGGLNVPSRLVVPPMSFEGSVGEHAGVVTSPEWPVESRGLPLGHLVRQLRRGRWTPSAHTVGWLNQTGFEWVDTRRRSFDLVCVALEAHQSYFGDMLVPRYFCVPAEGPWPEDTWGLHLGNRVRNIRFGLAYTQPKHVARLDAMGFYEAEEHL